MLGIIIGISVVKRYSDKLGCWIGIILVTLLNIEVGNCEVLSMYWALGTILLCSLGGWYMSTRDGTEVVSHYVCPCCVWIFLFCITFGKQTRIFLVCLFLNFFPWPSWLNENNMPPYNILIYYWVKYEDNYNEGCLEKRTNSCAKSIFLSSKEMVKSCF